jgi:hypothetical protein
MMQTKFLLHRVFNWEYWPQWLVYLPIMPIYLYYTIKARTPFFNVAANPNMENGGYMMESKFTIYNQLPQQLVPATFLVTPGSGFNEVLEKLQHSTIIYPFYCKPDIGGKGRGVVKIDNEQQLLHYHKQSAESYLVQAAIPYKNEAGIFYCRMPGQQKGFISGIVGKAPMLVTGNGTSTLQQLIEAVPRYYFQRRFLFATYQQQLQTVLAKGEVIALSEIGNHSRGSLFTDLTHLNNPQLEAVFDAISTAYNTFYFGRYDVKFNSWEDLYRGKNYMIIELNGCGSEPTHIYDPTKKIWKAWKIIIQHWRIMYAIASQHHKKGVPYLSFKEGMALQKMEKQLAFASSK